MYSYDSKFFATADRSAAYSADAIIELLVRSLPIKSVLDLGCGQGLWPAKWLAHGVQEVVGVDGPYVDVARLYIPQTAFVPYDLATPLSLDRHFDLVQSLEVAEHLDAKAADGFVDNLVRHGGLVLFSAAIPGQGGERHVNEQPLDYWRSKFLAHGYEAFDYIRPLIENNGKISYWYRNNVLLYVHRSRIDSLPGPIAASRVPPGEALANYLSLWMKIRTRAIQALPRPVVDEIARLKYRLLASGVRGS
jgi:SAM-dependent methyltransferase